VSATPDVVLYVGTAREGAIDCLEALRRHSPASRLIVVDDAPATASAEWVSAVAGMEVLDGMGAGRAAAFNMGLTASQSRLVCLMSARIVVSTDWLKLLEEALESDAGAAAVGPVAVGLHGQSIEATYAGLEDFELFASAYNHSDPGKWQRVVRLGDDCLLARRSALDDVGGFDENYTFGLFADDDLSIRLVTAGSSLMRCGNVLVHYAGPPLLEPEEERFVDIERQGLEARWGFSPAEVMLARGEIVALVEGDGKLDVLDLACGCGATLLEIANRHPGSALYGIERNEHAAAVAAGFVEVINGDVEARLDYRPESFDYVICDGVLERLRDPWRLLASVRRLLRPHGRVVASIPNVMHLSVLEQLLRGRFHYEDGGIIDRAALRFFTLAEIETMFAAAGFATRRYSATTVPISTAEQQLAETLAESFGAGNSEYLVQQYLVESYRVVAEA
jgi:SAM-dependent methyltransferase